MQSNNSTISISRYFCCCIRSQNLPVEPQGQNFKNRAAAHESKKPQSWGQIWGFSGKKNQKEAAEKGSQRAQTAYNNINFTEERLNLPYEKALRTKPYR